MEDIAREAGSINLDEETLFSIYNSNYLCSYSWFCSLTFTLLMLALCYTELQSELEQMSVPQPMIYQPLCEVVEVIQ